MKVAEKEGWVCLLTPRSKCQSHTGISSIIYAINHKFAGDRMESLSKAVDVSGGKLDVTTTTWKIWQPLWDFQLDLHLYWTIVLFLYSPLLRQRPLWYLPSKMEIRLSDINLSPDS